MQERKRKKAKHAVFWKYSIYPKANKPLRNSIRNFRPTRIAMLQADTRQELDAILDHIETDILPYTETHNQEDDDEARTD